MLFIAACLAVFAIDVAAGPQISPWSLYLLPLLVAGWLFGGRASLGVALMASALIVLAAMLSGHPFASWLEFSVSWGNRTVSLLAAAWLVSVARSAVEQRSREESQQSKH